MCGFRNYSSLKRNEFNFFNCCTWLAARVAEHRGTYLGPIAHQFQAGTCVIIRLDQIWVVLVIRLHCGQLVIPDLNEKLVAYSGLWPPTTSRPVLLLAKEETVREPSGTILGKEEEMRGKKKMGKRNMLPTRILASAVIRGMESMYSWGIGVHAIKHVFRITIIQSEKG